MLYNITWGGEASLKTPNLYYIDKGQPLITIIYDATTSICIKDKININIKDNKTRLSGTRNIIFATLKIGQNDPEIPNLEFESHGFLEKC